jgi:ABC-type nitrate/sulfonate/bicarbonate transport system ATPase subunit
MIYLDRINKSYGSQIVLSDFNLGIKKSDRIGLIGDSGTGKTTVLNVIAGLVKPDSGEVKINCNRIGYIFQESRLMPWKTVLNNVLLSVKSIGIPKEEAIERCRAILDRLEIQKFQDYYPSQLSGGIAQRVSIARAFIIEPEVLLMDEPFNSLDPGLRNRLHDYVLELSNELNITLLYVSHFPEDVVKITNKVYLLKRERQLSIISHMKKDFNSEGDYISYLHSFYA